MSLRSPVVYIIPDDTAHAAHAAFPNGHPYLTLADELGALYANAQFASLFSSTGQPALDPARLAAILVFQFMEGLSDAQAAQAVCDRLSWKYALALPLTYSGFDSSVLSEFRTRLVSGALECLLLDTLLARLLERGLLKARGRQRTDSTHVLAAVRTTSRLVNLGETLRAALDDLAERAPAWLLTVSQPAWFELYGRRVDDYALPKGKAERAALAGRIGADGGQLLRALYAPSAPPALRHLPAVGVLRAVWVQQFYAPDEAGLVRWRQSEDQPPASQLIVSPYDLEARLGSKRELSWVGYKAHLTETCDPGRPRLITQVETTPATSADAPALGAIQKHLASQELLPAQQVVDGGYIGGPQLVESAQHGVQLVGPAPTDHSWQARAGAGFDVAHFEVDWESRQVRCPSGERSRSWQVKQSGREAGDIVVRWGRETCRGCGVREQCTRAAGGRTVQLAPPEQQAALAAARSYTRSAEFKELYRSRAGVEGTLALGIRSLDLRRSRYIGQAKTHLQQILIAVAMNIWRLVGWWESRPVAQTRVGAFARLGGRVPRGQGAGAG